MVSYTKYQDEGQFEKVIIAFDEIFLKKFLERHPYQTCATDNNDAFIFIEEDKLIYNFIQSLEPYYNGEQKLDLNFVDIKREELLMILLKNNSDLKDVFFNFNVPHKIDLESFMNQHFKFNISLERFAFMSGRSLSTFKREFKSTYNITPGKWLMKKRLAEAYFLLDKENKKPLIFILNLVLKTFLISLLFLKKNLEFLLRQLENPIPK